MRQHHTKNKGDLGLLHAQVDLAERGYGVLMPQTEHEAFDLVAYKEQTFWRIQVKYRAAMRGYVRVSLSSSWADRHGSHFVAMDRTLVDLVCIYCPDTRECYYVDPARFGSAVCLRVDPTRNRQLKGIVWAKDFTNIPVVPGVSSATRIALEGTSQVRHSRGSRADPRMRP